MMYLERLEDLSVYYFLKDAFSDAPYINIVDGYPDSGLVTPTISVEAGRIDIDWFELGNRNGIRVRHFFIDIFAETKSQRDDIGYRLLDLLQKGIVVYNYNEGFPPNVSPSSMGTLVVLSLKFDPYAVSADVSKTLRYRATIEFTAENNRR